MATALVILIILGCAAYHYFRGGIIKSFSMVIITITSFVITFGFFEALANLFISRAGPRVPAIVPWSFALSFILIFTLAFSLQQALVSQFTRKPADLGTMTEKIGRVVLGAFFGFLLSGVILTAAALAPLSPKYPYERIDLNNPNPERPAKSFLNSDGFITKFFSILSRGSFRAVTGQKSFASIHPDLLSQLYINRQAVSAKIPTVSISSEMSLPLESPAWFASKDLKDSLGNPVAASGENDLIVLRLGIKKSIESRGANSFLVGQIRLVCKPKGADKDFIAIGKNIYPIGFIKTENQMQRTKLKDKIEIRWDEFTDKLPDGSGKWIDFVFELPRNYTPLAIEFRQNSLARAPTPAGTEKALPSIIFIPASQCAIDSAEVQPLSSSSIYGVALTAETKLLEGLALQVENDEQWNRIQSQNSIKPPQWRDGKFDFVRAELIIDPNNNQLLEAVWRGSDVLGGFAAMLKPRTGYKLVALKCNNPAGASEISGQNLPSLVDINGRQHKAAGVIASGKKDQNTIYEVDYCAVSANEQPDGLLFDKNGIVSTPFPDKIWITQQVSTVSEFFVLYLIKPANDMVITSVKPADSPTSAGLVNYQGLLVK